MLLTRFVLFELLDIEFLQNLLKNVSAYGK